MSDDLEQRILRRIRAVVECPTEDFAALLDAAGINPGSGLRNHNWAGLDFSGEDLRGMDFSRCNLEGCSFDGAQIARARFDAAVLGRIIHDPDNDPCLPAVIATGVANLRAARDWQDYAVPGMWKKAELQFADRHLPIGAIFQDAPFAPEMIVVPAGTYQRGTSPEEVEALTREYGTDYREFLDWETPQREVTIGAPFAVGRFPVTFEEWDAAQKHPDWRRLSGIKSRRAKDEKWGREQRPVIDVSWNDAKAYAKWLSGVTGKGYRLLCEAEWEYSCRAGTTTRYCFGDSTDGLGDSAWFHGNSGSKTQPVGGKACNAWGLHDMHGNIWEWCEDTWHESYNKAPDDGTVWQGADASLRVLRGGSWSDDPQLLRSANRNGGQPDIRNDDVGFRIARTLLRP